MSRLALEILLACTGGGFVALYVVLFIEQVKRRGCIDFDLMGLFVLVCAP